MYLRRGTRTLHVIVKVFLFIDQLQKWITVRCSVGQVIPLVNKRTPAYFISFQQVCLHIIVNSYHKITIKRNYRIPDRTNKNYRISNRKPSRRLFPKLFAIQKNVTSKSSVQVKCKIYQSAEVHFSFLYFR